MPSVLQNDETGSTAGPAMQQQVPPLTLPSTIGPLELRTFCADRVVLYIYPATGVPERDPLLDPAPGWDHIPGAAGCTPQSLGFKQTFEGFAREGVAIAGISTQPLVEQADFARRHAIPFPLISDESLSLQRAWGLPVFTVGGRTFLKRMVLYISEHQIQRVMYPIIAPAESAQAMLDLLRR